MGQGPICPGSMGPRAQGPWALGPWAQGPWALGPKKWCYYFITKTRFLKKNIFWRNRPFIRSPKPETRTKMTANGLSSYQLFIKMLNFPRQKLNLSSVFDKCRKNIVRFYEKVIFWFDRTFGPFLKILCFSLCTPSCYYFFKIMTSWMILMSFCVFLTTFVFICTFLGPRALGPQALGPRALGPRALGPREFSVSLDSSFPASLDS